MWDNTQARYSGAIIGTIATDECQAQHAEQAHDLERGRKERRIRKASGKIGHRFLLGVAVMS